MGICRTAVPGVLRSAAISKQNLCEWRAGGFTEWQARQEALTQARELTADATELAAATDGRLTDHLATVLAGWNGEVDDDFRRRLRALRGLCQDIVELRRGDHSGARLNLERERLEREREKSEEEVVAQFEVWAKNPAVRDWICQAWITPEERRRRLREIFGQPPEDAVPTTAESNPVKLSQTEFDPHQRKQTG